MWHAQLTLTCLHLALLALLLLPLGWRTRESLFTLGASATALASFAALGQSQAVTAYGCSMMLCLLPLFAGVAARQPFWFTCIPSLATLTGSLIWLRGTTPETELMALHSQLLLTTAVLFAPIASYTLEHGRRLTWALQYIAREQLAELARTTQRLRSLSILDPLTGIPHRRQFELDLKRLWGEASRAARPMSLLILDVDHFKLFSDSLGHPAGDKCLKQVAALLAETAALEEASAYRIGGEEFAVLLPGRTLRDAHRLGEALCLAVRDAAIPHPQPGLSARMTISVGIATIIPKPGEDRRRLLIEADAALYAAKTSGRDRVGGLEVAAGA
jgi:diguanylate cyclase (GGDEF)-like protein